ncbi:MAG: glycosyltransferase family 39 protein [Lutibacter sp.]|nr:glycosyltransferase family 39 protein [Lutibacter sp.]
MKKNYVILALILIIVLFTFSSINIITWGLPKEIDLNSYHPDESAIFKSIKSMNPQEYDFNPKVFIYPSLYPYTVAVVLKISSLVKFITITSSQSFYETHSWELAKIFLIGRLVTLFFGIGCIIFTFLIGKRLYHWSVGLISALFLSIIPTFIIHSSLIKVDVPAAFWALVSIYFTLRIIKSNSFYNYLFAGLSAGFAAATKYNAVLCIIPLFVVHFQKYWKSHSFFKVIFHRFLIYASIMTLVGYFIGNPYSFFDLDRFFLDITNEMTRVHTGHMGFDINPAGFIYNYYIFEFLAVFPFMLGFPIYLTSLGGILLSTWYDWKKSIIILSFLAPYIIILGSWRVAFARYYIPLIPIFVIFSSLFIYYLFISVKKRKSKLLAISGLLLILIYMFAFTGSLILNFSNDPKDLANEWINLNVPENDTIGIFLMWSFTPPINQSKYNLILVQNQTYDTLKSSNPDYLVLSSTKYLISYRDKNQFNESYHFYNQLRTGKLNYKLIKKFESDYFNQELYQKLDPMFESYYLLPDIEIYKKENLNISIEKFNLRNIHGGYCDLQLRIKLLQCK